MNAITVCIERDEQGQYSVGIDSQDANEGQSMDKLMQPEGGMAQGGGMKPSGQMSEGQEDAGMSPAKDLEDALTQARSILSGGPQTEQQAFASA